MEASNQNIGIARSEVEAANLTIGTPGCALRALTRKARSRPMQNVRIFRAAITSMTKREVSACLIESDTTITGPSCEIPQFPSVQAKRSPHLPSQSQPHRYDLPADHPATTHGEQPQHPEHSHRGRKAHSRHHDGCGLSTLWIALRPVAILCEVWRIPRCSRSVSCHPHC